MPNVLLESLACGTPVAASRVGGTPEIVTAAVAGRLFQQRSPEALAAACREVLAAGSDPSLVRAFASAFGWDAPVAQQIALLQQVAGHA
jgi:glycosyltransferase involved in cell wall biosynthesis